MATYLMTFTFTQQGIQEIRNSPDRVEAAKKTIREMGGEVKVFCAVLGADFDTMFLLEAPDDQAAARMALAISALGRVRSTTRRAFTEDEFRAISSGIRT